MILMDQTNDELMIGIQRANNDYLYLSWGGWKNYKLQSYHTQIPDNYEGISGIGPTILVEWEE